MLCFRIVYIATIFLGSVISLGLVWNIADCMNALMAIPNLISLLCLSGIIVHETRKYLWRDQLNAAAFCQVLETAGLRSVVYMNGHWSGAMYDLDALADWPIWYAGYGQPPTLERGVLLWQYTEEGTLPGITGPVDMDLWFEKSDT